MDYVVSNAMEREGIRAFTHKFHLGHQPYYFKRTHEELFIKLASKEEDFSVTNADLRSAVHTQKEQMTKNALKMSLRVTVQLTEGALGTFGE